MQVKQYEPRANNVTRNAANFMVEVELGQKLHLFSSTKFILPSLDSILSQFTPHYIILTLFFFFFPSSSSPPPL